MPIHSQKNSPPVAAVLRRPARVATLSKVLGIILLPAMMHHVGTARGAVVTNPYAIVVNWTCSPCPYVTGYRIYYGTNSGSYSTSVIVGNVTSNTITGLAAGVTYFIAVTACGTNGIESPFSAEISFVPGLPTVQLGAASGGQLVLTVAGLIGQSYDVQATQDFITWSVIGTVTTGAGGTAGFTDTNAAGFIKRFYRTKATP
jgi:hypothetical protein